MHALALLLVATSVFAQAPHVEVTVENIRLEGSTTHAIVRLANKRDHGYRGVQILCAFLSKGRAVDTTVDLVPNIQANETVYAKVIGPIGAHAGSIDEMQCHVTNTH
jgi:hypothetical protein